MLGLIFIFLVVSTIAMLAVVAWSKLQNKMQPEMQVRAIAMRRRVIDYSIDGPTSPWAMLINGLGWGPGRSRCDHKHIARLSGEVRLVNVMYGLITFGVNGEEIELLVPENVFMDLQDGQMGTLVYQGEIFKGFTPDPERNEPTRQTFTPGKPLV